MSEVQYDAPTQKLLDNIIKTCIQRLKHRCSKFNLNKECLLLIKDGLYLKLHFNVFSIIVKIEEPKDWYGNFNLNIKLDIPNIIIDEETLNKMKNAFDYVKKIIYEVYVEYGPKPKFSEEYI